MMYDHMENDQSSAKATAFNSLAFYVHKDAIFVQRLLNYHNIPFTLKQDKTLSLHDLSDILDFNDNDDEHVVSVVIGFKNLEINTDSLVTIKGDSFRELVSIIGMEPPTDKIISLNLIK